ncbi:5745_t:CDS:2, partial [Funneliformis caledonium]
EIESISSTDSIINSNCSDTSENMERDQNNIIIASFQGSNESSLGMTLPVVMYGSLSGTTTPQLPFNIPSRQYDEEENDIYTPDYKQNILFGYVNNDDKTLQGTSFFDNTNELEREGIPSRIPRRVTFNTRNDRRSPSPVRVENIQQLVASTLSSNQSSRPSNLRQLNIVVCLTPWHHLILSEIVTHLQPLVLQPQIGNQGSSRLTSTTTSQSVPSNQPSNNINISQPILTPQPAIVPVGGNNDNTYLQVIQGLARWLQGQQTRKQ